MFILNPECIKQADGLSDVLIYVPLSSIQHFVWPLTVCILADICNHTWIPECGEESGDFRLFIDECDMLEYDCDFNRTYKITNYSECFRPATGCPTHHYLRVGNYKYMADHRRIIYAPTNTPSLPKHMLHGKRRYTPLPRRLKRRHMQKPVLRKVIQTTKTKKETVVLKRVSVLKNGKMMVKVVKGLAVKKNDDSDFLQ